MESTPDIELINLAIQKLLEEKRNKNSVDSEKEDDDAQLLSRLLSQLKSLKKDGRFKQSEELNLPAGEGAVAMPDKAAAAEEIGVEEIVKELKEVKRQNRRTHWLLSVMIAFTVVWQVSELSILLKLKNGLTHPFRSFGSMLVGMLPHSASAGTDVQELDKRDNNNNNHNHHQLVDHSLPSVKMPDLPHLDLPHLGSNTEGKD